VISKENAMKQQLEKKSKTNSLDGCLKNPSKFQTPYKTASVT